MEPEGKIIKAGTNKKVRNKGWNCMAVSEVEPKLSQQNNSFKHNNIRYKNITEMSQKYSFNINAVLGSGFASTVYLGAKINTNQMICIKAIDLLVLGLSSPYVSMIHQQIQCLQLFSSEFIVKLYDIYQSNTFYYLIMELCIGGDLYKMLKLSPSDLPPAFVETIVLQIVCGLHQIHGKGFVHRDLKTENIFISHLPQNIGETIKVKIGDLGFCIKNQNIKKFKTEGKNIENVGSPIYMSPQVCQYQNYSFSSDVYALGIIWYELYHKRAPWEATTQKQLLQKKLTIEVSTWRIDIAKQVKQLILKCINNNPQQRPTSTELVDFLQKKLPQPKQ